MSRSNKVGKTATSVFTDDKGALCVRYHQTVVARKHADGVIELDSGGWRTATTKLRMNQFAHQYGLGFGVYQEKGEWYVSAGDNIGFPFRDGMTFSVSAGRAAA